MCKQAHLTQLPLGFNVSTTKNLIYFCLTATVFAIAVNCSGGSAKETVSPVSSEQKIEFKLVNSYKQKFATLTEDAVFIISSDLSDRTDPQEATHARLRMYNDKGKLQTDKIQPILRQAIPPYDIDQSTRFITVEGILDGDYSCTIELGQDFGEDSINRQEVVYYSGSLSGITIKGNQVFVSGSAISTIIVPVSINRDQNATAFSLQGLLDFSSIPRLIEPTVTDSANTVPKISQTSIETIDVDLNFSFSTVNLVLKDSIEFQSQFFELKNIPIIYTSFYGNAEAGDPQNFLLKTFIQKDEILSGNLILFDWETTLNSTICRWFNEFNETSSPSTLESEQAKMYKVYNIIKKLLYDPYDGYIETTEKELALLSIVYNITLDLNLGRNNRLSPANAFHGQIAAPIKGNSLTSTNKFLFPSANINRPIKVLVTGRTDPIFFNSQIDASAWDATINGNTQSNINPSSTAELYQTEIEPNVSLEVVLELIKSTLEI